MHGLRDEFLSEEDLDLRNMDGDELEAYWNAWLLQAQATNDADADTYSHGVFVQCRVRNGAGIAATTARSPQMRSRQGIHRH